MRKHNKLIAMLMAFAMVFAYMPAIAFAEEGEAAVDFDGAPVVEEASEAAGEDLLPTEPERIMVEPKNIADDAYIVGISFSPNPITVWGPNLAVSNPDGSIYYDIYGRHKWVYPDETYDYYPFAPGDTLVVSFSDGSKITYICKALYRNGYYDAWFTDGEAVCWPGIEPDRLGAGNNTVTLNLYDEFTTPVTIFVDTPELVAQREEAARQGVPDGSIPKVKTKKPSTGKKSITVKWKKLTKKQLKKSKATNYEVWVCPNLGFAKGETSEHVIKKNKAGVKIKKVPKGTYYVKVRAIRDVGGVRYAGPWTKPKQVKVKK